LNLRPHGPEATPATGAFDPKTPHFQAFYTHSELFASVCEHLRYGAKNSGITVGSEEFCGMYRKMKTRAGRRRDMDSNTKDTSSPAHPEIVLCMSEGMARKTNEDGDAIAQRHLYERRKLL
jgi:hypothetical protein